MLVLAVILLGGAASGGLIAAKHHAVFTPSHSLPSIEGMTPATAESRLASDHFTVRVSGHRHNVLAPVGWIVRSRRGRVSPQAGEHRLGRDLRGPAAGHGARPRVDHRRWLPCRHRRARNRPPRHDVHLCDVDHRQGRRGDQLPTEHHGDLGNEGPRRHLEWAPHVAVPDLAGLSKSAVTAALEKRHLAVAFSHAAVLGLRFRRRADQLDR